MTDPASALTGFSRFSRLELVSALLSRRCMKRLLWSVGVVWLSACGPQELVEATNAAAQQTGCSALGASAFTQGLITADGRFTHLAISGPGYFIVQSAERPTYRRLGNFELDAEGRFVDSMGHVALAVDASGSLTPARVGPAVDPPQATSLVTLAGNLDAQAPLQTWDPTEPWGHSELGVEFALITGEGVRVPCSLFFTHTMTGSWEFHALVDGAQVLGGTGGVPEEIASGTLHFEPSHGLFIDAEQTSNFAPTGGVAQSLAFSFEGLSQFSDGSHTTQRSTDGNPAGLLATSAVASDGTIVNHYSNGMIRSDRRIAIATFSNPQALDLDANGTLSANAASGPATLRDTPIVGGALEAIAPPSCFP